MPTTSITKIKTKQNNLFLRVARGHFATNSSHSNYYIDVAAQKSRLSEAKAIAHELCKNHRYSNRIVDTVLCLDGTEVTGACLADELTKADFVSINAHKSIYVVSPEITNSSQILFRDNIIPMIEGKSVMLLAVSYSSGRSVEAAIGAVRYYGGNPVGVSAIFSTQEKSKDSLPIYSCFNPDFLGDYEHYNPQECPMCKAGQKLDALINGFGYSLLK